MSETRFGPPTGVTPAQADGFREELTSLLNRYCHENGSNTPDFVLAVYVVRCLTAFDEAVNCREGWYGR